MTQPYDFRAIEQRWRARWEESGVYRTPEPSSRTKMYVLDYFPYPSGEGLSVGHAKNYVPTDVFARYYRMRGLAVLHPMGWDAFGLPAENDALLRGKHPAETTRAYAANYQRQLTLLGCSYDWSREMNTSDPAFYRWTQWGFLLMYRRGLVYRAMGRQWWCPKCRTILANEQVENGRCWRHSDTPVEQRTLEQWYVRTTAYAERLLNDLDTVDWPEHIKTMQRNWIGRSEGAEIRFPIAWSDASVTVFTTRPETLAGATFIALAPEHPMVDALTTPERQPVVSKYVDEALRRSEVERMATTTGATGMLTGSFASHPITGELLPIYVAEYVLSHYGTGAIMGVPAADERDAEFARRFGLRVAPFAVSGASPAETIAELERRGVGGPVVRYRMRDWLISRQRFWGAPIPIVYCARCGAIPVREDDLPVRLPTVKHYEPSGSGRSPLAGIPEFVHTRCPNCGGPAERETDTLDGFADSNWYFLRFADPHDDRGPWNPEAVKYWFPVDWYVGGAEHAVMHLLYARFFTKVLFDSGLVPFAEPFSRLRNQGSMLSPRDGARMSKSRGNVVTPDEVIEKAGADALRVAVMFIGPFEQDVTWDPEAVTGATRFVRRLHAMFARAANLESKKKSSGDQTALIARVHQSVKMAGEAIERFRFNVLIADLMTLLNDLEDLEPKWRDTTLWRDLMLTVVRIAAPVVPFVAEEAWSMFGQPGSVHRAAWPQYETSLLEAKEATIVVQVDGRVRDRITVAHSSGRDGVIDKARARPRVQAALRGRDVTDVVLVPDRVLNFVTAKGRRKENKGAG